MILTDRFKTMETSAPRTVVQQVLDLPADRLAAVVGGWPEPALLVSGPGTGAAGRWSILAAYPRLVFEATGAGWSLRSDTGSSQIERGDPLNRFAELAHQFGLAESAAFDEPHKPNACPFQGGMIGFLGYDLAPLIERLPRKAPAESRLPDLHMA